MDTLVETEVGSFDASPCGRDHDIVPVEAPADGTLARLEGEQIERVLSAERRHVTRSAQRLGIPRSTFYPSCTDSGSSPWCRCSWSWVGGGG